jgi:hypothetical protein
MGYGLSALFAIRYSQVIFRRPSPPEAITMPLHVPVGAPTLFIRRQPYEASGLARAAIDERLGLTADEFRVEGDLVAIGPIYAGEDDLLGAFIAELESLGLVYYDDFFELSGNWPDWLRIHATGPR